MLETLMFILFIRFLSLLGYSDQQKAAYITYLMPRTLFCWAGLLREYQFKVTQLRCLREEGNSQSPCFELSTLTTTPNCLSIWFFICCLYLYSSFLPALFIQYHCGLLLAPLSYRKMIFF